MDAGGLNLTHPYGCTKCDRRFKDYGAAAKHGPGTHFGKKLHICKDPKCSRTVSTDTKDNHVCQELGAPVEKQD